MEDESEMENARRYFAKNNLEGERPTRFFCSMNKKMKSKAQFETVHVKEENEKWEEVIGVVTKQWNGKLGSFIGVYTGKKKHFAKNKTF